VPKEPSFDLQPYMLNLKGKSYLPVAPRIAWLREIHPDAQIDVEMVFHDMDAKLAIMRATIKIPSTGASASDFGSETAKDFGDYLEKSATKAIGRCLASLGFGTLMARELDEGGRVADSPQPARNGQQQARTETTDTKSLLDEVNALLESDPDAASKLPKPALQMTSQELSKTLTWLQGRARQRQ